MNPKNKFKEQIDRRNVITLSKQNKIEKGRKGRRRESKMDNTFGKKLGVREREGEYK